MLFKGSVLDEFFMYVLHYKVEYLKASYLNIESLLQEGFTISCYISREFIKFSIRKTGKILGSVLEDLSGTD